jgi:hypothetical protein
MSPFSVCLTFSSWVFPSSPHRSASSYLASLISCLLASLISLIFLLLFHFTLFARFLPRVARFVGNTGIIYYKIIFLNEMDCKRKHSKYEYSSIISSNYIFKGLTLETLDPWCKETMEFIKVIGERLIAE